jgi:hypothetical protein
VNVAYVDTSCLVAIAFGEPGSAGIARALDGFDRLVGSNLVEAELRAAFAREQVADPCERLLANLAWLHPDRSLGPECQRVLREGYVRGADLWHLACALFLTPDPTELTFATLDARQGDVAALLGFQRLVP